MSDLIDRQAAIDALKKEQGHYLWDDAEIFCEYNHAIKAIEELPTAQPYTEAEIQKMQDVEQAMLDKAYECGKRDALPMRKKGKWIKKPEYHGDDTSGFIDNCWTCDKCGKQATVNSWGIYDLSNFCPNCGADMRGEEE